MDNLEDILQEAYLRNVFKSAYNLVIFSKISESIRMYQFEHIRQTCFL